LTRCPHRDARHSCCAPRAPGVPGATHKGLVLQLVEDGVDPEGEAAGVVIPFGVFGDDDRLLAADGGGGGGDQLPRTETGAMAE
jgi:hypothetical protein